MSAVHKSVSYQSILTAQCLSEHLVYSISAHVAVSVTCCAFKTALAHTIVDKSFQHFLSVILGVAVYFLKHLPALILCLGGKR